LNDLCYGANGQKHNACLAKFHAEFASVVL